MALVKKVNDKSPQWGKDCWLADNATLTGDVVMGDNCTVWFNAVIRGDVHYIKIGVIAAGAVVLAGTIVENNSIYAGIPAKKVKDTGKEMEATIIRIASNYPKYASWYKDE